MATWPGLLDAGETYSVLHVRLESKSHENLFVLVMCDVALQRDSETLKR
jgi:hypothetical protein